MNSHIVLPDMMMIPTETRVRGLALYDPEQMETHVTMSTPHNPTIRSRSRSPRPGSRKSSVASRTQSRGRSPVAARRLSPQINADRLLTPDLLSTPGSRRAKSPLGRKLETEGSFYGKQQMTRNDHSFLSTSSFAPSSGSDEEIAEEVDPKNELKELQERQKKKKMIKKEAQQELVAIKRINSRSSLNKSQEDISAAVNEINLQIAAMDNVFGATTSDSFKIENFGAGKNKSPKYVIKLPKQKMGGLLDQPIPPMMKSNSYAEVDLPDCLVKVKGFSPIRINKYGEKHFDMHLETTDKRDRSHKREKSIGVKLSVDKIQNMTNALQNISNPRISTVTFSLHTPPQLWREIIQNFGKFAK
ncbi:Oidioi.mRNA.OKI2018_I69.chr2.g4982.t1.cds [Oikopleura dioica]|uniref:Oidioi.mRNA.OKI2018_I69.chr2.g4982.t1.cds n=1 Tax=Oikopleura dioica TaxID=34765 RepID=A0ABN7T3B0_OIKDI|nr:Oidioi.mRNA.OKI2018_I69.chr2.g4982.t1.cds [Oikopleura dioica]